MKKFFLFWLILIFLRVTAFPQSCLPLGITFHTQEQIDSFQVSYPGCTEIEGNVNIGLYQEETDINNLNGLSVLNSIEGHLIISHNANLTSLEGLNSIHSIHGQLGVFSNPALTSMEGLEGLVYVDALTIENNASLIDFDGLENLATIFHVFDIFENPTLTNLTGLIRLNSIGGNLSITNNDALTSLDGLDNLVHIGSGLAIQYNNSLENITALSNLVHIGSGLAIEFNNALEDISALANLVSVQNDDNWSFIRIKNNIALTSLTGLNNIDPESIQELSVGWNVALPDCDVNSICQYLADPVGEVSIQYNAPGCNSREEVEAACLEDVDEVNSQQSTVTYYPNPITGRTTFDILLPETSEANLAILNSLGQVVATILDQSLEKGNHQVTWSTGDLNPGIYFYRLQAGSRYFTGKMVVAR